MIVGGYQPANEVWPPDIAPITKKDPNTRDALVTYASIIHRYCGIQTRFTNTLPIDDQHRVWPLF